MQNSIPAQLFFSHVQKLRQIWSNKTNHEMDSILIINGKLSDNNSKTVSVVGWFFAGYNISDTILTFSPNSIIIYASDRKLTFLANLKEDSLASKYNLSFVSKSENSKQTFTKIWKDLHGDNSKPKTGLIINDEKTGLIAEDFTNFVNEQSHTKIEATNIFVQCFMTKDAQEIETLRKSSKVTSYFFNKLIKEAEIVIDNGKPTKHSQLSNKMQKMMDNQGQIKKCAIKLSSAKIEKNYIETGASCTIQSGGYYSPKHFLQSNNNVLKSDCIMLSFGTMYRSYNTYIGRTLLIDPTQQQKSIYKKIQTLSKVIVQNLRVGVKICDVYKKGKMFIKDNLPDLEPPKNFGFGMGIFACQTNLSISQVNDRVIKEGFCFLISCNFPEIKFESKKGTKVFGVQLLDNVIVSEKGQQLITSDVSKALAEISYSLDDEEETTKKAPKPRTSSSNIIESSRRRKVQQATNERLKNQRQRNQHQEKLKKEKLEELKQRVNENFNGDFMKQKNIECNRIECYKSQQQLPKDMKKNLIYIDNRNNAILLPIGGSHVPFHISILKSVVKNDEGKFASLRFNFSLPSNVGILNFPKFVEPTVFIKEMVFRSQQIGRIAELEKQVKNLVKKFRQQLSQKHAKEDIVQQQKINLNKGKRPILRELFARPTFGQKKNKGTLQCHLNGFRYNSNKGQVVDVSFSNVKYAFFQPCQKDIIAAIHFKMIEPIIVGKKKTEDVQFYTEGGILSEDVSGRGRGDDSDDEERQKQAKRRIDRDFESWIKHCGEFINGAFEFQIPNRDRSFYGTTQRSNVLLQPTKNCLINITEPTSFVYALSEVEVVWFQRMTGNVRYFDLTILNKDYQKNTRVNSISIKDVEKVKDWLDDNNIIFYDNKISLNWSKFLQGVRQDFKQFVEDGAWTAWQEGQDDEAQDEQPGDSQFSAQQSEIDEGSQNSEESQSDFEEQKDSDSSVAGGSEADQDLSEEGLSWDEMEEKAEREDREKVRRQLEKDKEQDIRKIKRR